MRANAYSVKENKVIHKICARGRTRTGTEYYLRGILSPLCLPISPPGRHIEASVGFEPTNNGFANRSLKPLGYDANFKIASKYRDLES